MKLYMAIWSGGWDAPSVQGFQSMTEADTKASEWADQADWDAGDSVMVISIDTITAQTEVVQSFVPKV